MLSPAEQAAILRFARGAATVKKRAGQLFRAGLISKTQARKNIRIAEENLRELLKEVG